MSNTVLYEGYVIQSAPTVPGRTSTLAALRGHFFQPLPRNATARVLL